MTDQTDRTVERLDPAEAPAFYAAAERGFGEEARDSDIAFWEGLTDPERRFVVRDRGAIVATSAIEPFRLTVPRGGVSMAGVTAVTVLPTHRRRGLLRAMMGRMLDDAVERGEPVAGLWASEASIYGRFGFGRAASAQHVTIDARRVRLARVEEEVALRFRDADEAYAEVPSIYDALRPEVPGMLDVSAARWEWLRLDPEHWREGAGPRFVVTAGDDRGYAAYRVKSSWEGGVPEGTVVLDALAARDVPTWVSLWRFLLSIDLVSTVTAGNRPVDEPFDLLIDDPRRTRPQLSDTLYVRVLDVPAALSARGADADGDVVVEVVDDLGYAGGRYRVTAEGGGLRCARTDAGSDLTMGVRELGRAYLGGVPVRRLERVGLVAEHREGAAATLDRLLHSPVAPWCPFEF